jgi:hypothetical protein
VTDQHGAIYPKLIQQGKNVVGIVLDTLPTDAIGSAMCGEVDSVHALIVKAPDLRRPGQVVPARAVDQQHCGAQNVIGFV